MARRSRENIERSNPAYEEYLRFRSLWQENGTPYSFELSFAEWLAVYPQYRKSTAADPSRFTKLPETDWQKEIELVLRYSLLVRDLPMFKRFVNYYINPSMRNKLPAQLQKRIQDYQERRSRSVTGSIPADASIIIARFVRESGLSSQTNNPN